MPDKKVKFREDDLEKKVQREGLGAKKQLRITSNHYTMEKGSIPPILYRAIPRDGQKRAGKEKSLL